MAETIVGSLQLDQALIAEAARAKLLEISPIRRTEGKRYAAPSFAFNVSPLVCGLPQSHFRLRGRLGLRSRLRLRGC